MEGFICFCAFIALLLSIATLAVVFVYVKRAVSVFKEIFSIFENLGVENLYE